MADDASSTGSNEVAIVVDEIKALSPEEARPSVQMLAGPKPEKSLFPEEAGASVQKLAGPTLEEELVPLVFEIDRAILDALLKARRWLDAAEHVAKSLLLHKDGQHDLTGAPAAGVGPADDMLLEHPELIVLLRRQHALELLGEGKREEAQEYYHYSIFGAACRASRTPHLDALLSDLRKTIAAAVTDGVQPADLPLNLPAETGRTCRDVRDYLRVYFPDFDRSAEVAASMATSRSVLYGAAPFGEVVGEKQYRCLVCHQTLSFHNVPDQRLNEHLHYYCQAVTPAVRRRLPRANRPPSHAAPEAARRRR